MSRMSDRYGPNSTWISIWMLGAPDSALQILDFEGYTIGYWMGDGYVQRVQCAFHCCQQFSDRCVRQRSMGSATLGAACQRSIEISSHLEFLMCFGFNSSE
jgi:hypothetical protein